MLHSLLTNQAMEDINLRPNSVIWALFMCVMILFPAALLCEATRLPHRELLQRGGKICPACLCCEETSVRRPPGSCCPCCVTPVTPQSQAASP
ncbi:hypothetical protein AgCh_020891 [Apium graveolens]